MMAPAYHPEWLVKFWLMTPGLNILNPHYLLIVLAVAIALIWFLRRRRMPAEDIIGEEDQLFKHLLLRKKVIEEELSGLEGKLVSSEITDEKYETLKLDYESRLDQVQKELQQYI